MLYSCTRMATVGVLPVLLQQTIFLISIPR